MLNKNKNNNNNNEKKKYKSDNSASVDVDVDVCYCPLARQNQITKSLFSKVNKSSVNFVTAVMGR